ncbi:helix-turn-helix transcriptional regulator [Shewanella sairae]|uniref:helix-turn-helix transcriptional regulator n=1 Tax=Shewanella sairae TaxID=190310 RepID=UPI001C81518F|nr:LuxR C-terminal-related transcriptional regulator [Shewanella sairae]MCL1132603.1 LuxR C-terminal-related transcriptional regulator [Shewanella sairae]
MATKNHTKITNNFNICPQEHLFTYLNLFFPELSVRELEAIYWLSQGLKLNDVSMMMSVKPESVRSYLSRCKIKLKQDNNTQLRLLFQCRLNSVILIHQLSSLSTC